jgi:hypothetical protein
VGMKARLGPFGATRSRCAGTVLEGLTGDRLSLKASD